MNPIKFYKLNEEFGAFSNFSRHPIKINNKIYKTSEHYYQSQKFVGTEYEEKVRMSKTPTDAARIGRDRTLPLREDWEIVKEDVMMLALRTKFTQHTDLKRLLLSSGDRQIIEHTKKDNYWADGGDGTGKNRLGVLLMKLREDLRYQ